MPPFDRPFLRVRYHRLHLQRFCCTRYVYGSAKINTEPKRGQEKTATAQQKGWLKVEDADRLLTSAEACDLLRVTPVTLLEWRKRGHLKALKTPGGFIRYRESDVKAVLQEEIIEV